MTSFRNEAASVEVRAVKDIFANAGDFVGLNSPVETAQLNSVTV